MTATIKFDRNAHYANIWAGRKAIDITHFYSIGMTEDGSRERFAYGYFTHDGIFCQGVTEYEPEEGFRRGMVAQPPVW